MKKVAVIGAGTMGNGIAHVFAQYGHDVNMIDVSESALQKAIAAITKNLDRQIEKGKLSTEQKEATLNRIKIMTNIEEGVADRDLIVEAATENVNIKLDLFRKLDAVCKPSAILASNTSSISITKISSVTNRPTQVIGMHFMNPVPMMKLVEVIRGKATTDAITNEIMELAKKLDKVPVEVNDAPGFVANRILIPMINEAIYTLAENIADVEGIDTVMKLGMSHPMGPLQLADFIGLDVCLSIMHVIQDGFEGNKKYTPCSLLEDMVKNGELGVKSGKGFYVYEKGSKELKVADRFRKKVIA